MEKVRYMISDAANIVNVESHVLRYWEDELELNIPRNEMGHRYYTQDNIQEFQKIKELKEQGYQLKAIRMIIHSASLEEPTITNASEMEPAQQNIRMLEQDRQPVFVQPQPEERQGKVRYMEQKGSIQPLIPAQSLKSEQAVADHVQNQNILDNTDRMEQFTNLMTQIVGKALAANNQALSKNISEDVGEQVIKEMNYLMREREEAEEERFRRLDSAIRGNMKKKEAKKAKWGKKKMIGEPERA